ncbi:MULTISPECIES: spore germination protein [unclassified Ruminococcus]|uniref:spore germination protein n=1 Tax=unclassified Ruminococcus TaxID=2608920 RepID=UPI00210893A1|nr:MULTISPECIES: spore germination protein [unclassified Ruminococcus]MCQ4022521.1 spore germination protein [Ruminococcus sp. zg-924]MCQ4115135.1 spore germination protein [Ruminococcus sp. zg-921]
MGILDFSFNKKQKKQSDEQHCEPLLYCELEKNISYMKSRFGGSADFTVRRLLLSDSTDAAIITMEGMSNKESIALSITNPIMEFNFKKHSENKIDLIESRVLSASEIVRVIDFSQAFTLVMSGFTLFLVDGCDIALAIGVQGFSFRGISESETDVVQRGSREGFSEPLRINMTLVRRRLKTPDLRFESMQIGTDTKTDIALCYLDSAVSKDILDELKRRLKAVPLKNILAAGYLVPFLDRKGDLSLFSGVGVTERPDTVCGKISEGRIAVLIDGTPSVLIVPYLFVENFQTIDDYSNRAYFASLTRILKYIAFFVAVFTPGMYVAVACYNPELFPQGILNKVASSVAQTPFSVFTEILLIHFIYEIMREAGLRLPRPLGHAVSIVGALVLGETAVSSGLIGAPTLMVVAITAISSYVIPDLYPAVAVLRISFIVAGGVAGLFGITLLFCAVLINMCAKKSFGVPYMSPLSPFSFFGMRDTIIRAGWRVLAKRQSLIQNQKGSEAESEEE